MDQILLLKIETLHARMAQETGLKLRYKQREFYTGTVAAHLDDEAGAPANLGLLNLTTGAIRLRWAIVATMPFMADAFASGAISPKESGLLRMSFDESGQVREDGCGFDAVGGGEIAPGSLFSSAKMLLQSNFVRTCPDSGSKAVNLTKALSSGKSVRCALIPESYLDLTLPSSLGGGTHRVNLLGAFVLAPIMTLGTRGGTKKSRR